MQVTLPAERAAPSPALHPALPLEQRGLAPGLRDGAAGECRVRVPGRGPLLPCHSAGGCLHHPAHLQGAEPGSVG